MDASGGDLARGVEATQCGATVKAGAETAARVVRGRCDRDAIGRRVEPNLTACGGD